MERLILEITVTDDYNYSYELSLPIIYKDKESAIDNLYNLLNEYQKNKEQIQEEIRLINEKIDNKLIKLKKINILHNEKKIIELKKELLELSDLQRQKYDELNKPIIFAGQTLSLDTFTHSSDNSKKIDIEIPRIYTIDDFFKPIEQKVEQLKTPKT